MSDDMKMTVQLFIETNRSFIEQKTYNTFRIECVKDKELKDLDVEKMVQLLKSMFSFKGNPQMNIFFERAPNNIEKYIAQQYKGTSQMDDLVIDIQKLMGIIYHCVQNGFEESMKEQVKEEVKEQIKQQIKEEIKKEEIREEPKQQVKKVQPIKNRILKKEPEEEPPQEKPKKVFIPKPKTPEKKNFIQKHTMPERNMGPRYLAHMNNQTKPKKEQEQIIPPVSPVNLAYIEKHRKMIDDRLFHLFRHYCTQQQNIGASTTFDRIKYQCQQMTVGKFLIFCKTTNLFADKAISKLFLTSKYKKVSEGFKEIGFEKFKQLLVEVDEQYMKIKRYKIEGQIPTYEARLMLQNESFKKMKKDVDLPFTTKQKNGRELKEYSTISYDKPRYQEKKPKQLTTHSGRFSKDLKQDLDLKVKKSKKKREKKDQPKIVKLDNISEMNAGVSMDWIIEEDETDQLFMKDYKLRDVVGNLKKRVGDLQKMQRKRLY